MILNKYCPVCSAALLNGIEPWHFRCRSCAYENADLSPAINAVAPHEQLDEAARENGLRKLRKRNFKELVTQIKKLKPGGGRLLDVGCAHGWFLEAAREHFDVLGIEPDDFVQRATAAGGLPVRAGYFPDALEDGEKFDIIVFNDVFEHIPNSIWVLDACHAHLNEGGLLVLNLPSSRGLFYKLSKFFKWLGYSGFFERLWQKDLPSPHLHYFDSQNLKAMLERNGFLTLKRGRLPVLRFSGLYTRISYTGTMHHLTTMGICSAVALALPLFSVFPSDIIYIIGQKHR